MVKLLIVEDEIIARNGIISLIESSNLPCRVVGTAEDGYNGMLKAKAFSPDLVLTDIKMPRMDGLAMIKNIVSWGEPPHFVILSGYAEFSYAQQAIRYGVLDYLLKPVTTEELLDILGGICSQLENPSGESLGDPTGEVPEEYPNIVVQMIHYIQGNYNKPISLQDIADQLRITPAYASSIFSKTTGKPFSSYLRDVRLAHAKGLLLTGQDKIYEIAYKTGFNDEKYFSRTFKKHMGVSAREYAQMKRG